MKEQKVFGCVSVSSGSFKNDRRAGRGLDNPAWVFAAIAAACIWSSRPCEGQIEVSAYIANSGSNDVSVINTTTNMVVGSPIGVGSQPVAVAVTPDGKYVYVTNNGINTISVIDAATNTVVGPPIALGTQAAGIAVTPDGKYAYVTNTNIQGFTGNTVSVVNTATNTVLGSSITVGSGALGVAITPDGKYAYVANNHGSTVSVINTATNTVIGPPITVGNSPVGVAVTPNGKYVFVTNNSDNTVSVISTATHSVVGPPIGVGNDPAGVMITPDGRFAYVANNGSGAVNSNTVSVIDIATDTVVGLVTVGNKPLGIDVTPDGKYVYVTNSNDGTVSVINTATNTVLGAPIAVGSFPIAFGFFVGPNIIVAQGGPLSVANDAALTPLGFGQFVNFNGGTLKTTGDLVTLRKISLLAQGGTIDTNGSNATFSGNIINSGSLTKIGAGTLTLSGTNTYSGGTNLYGGVLAVNSDGNLGSGALTFNGGTLEALAAGGGIASTKAITLNAGGGTFLADAGTTSTLSGAISGVGSLTKNGAGTLILTGFNTYSGGTTISAGTLELGNGGTNIFFLTTGNIIGNVTDNGTLAFNRVGFILGNLHVVNTFAGVISGTGSVVQLGTDTLVLTANNTYSGGTTIQDGTLVAGTPSAAQRISNALGTGNVFLQGGTLRTPSLDPLTINVGGNYTQGQGGTLALGVGGINGEDYDRVQVGGNASLNGTLAVNSLNNFRPVNGNAFEVLRTNGSRSGQFAQVNDFLNNDPKLQRIDIYAPNGVALLYAAVPTPSPTPNPRPPIDIEVSKPLPPVDPEEPLLISSLLGILNPTAEQLTALYEIGFSGANTQRLKLDERFDDIQRGSTGFVSYLPPAPAPVTGTGTGKSVVEKQPVLQSTPEDRWGVWANGWGDWVTVDNDGSAKGYNFTTGGFIIGVDYRITDHFAVGLMGSYAHTATNLQPSGDIDVNTGRGGLYATYFDHGFYINAAAYGGYNSYDTSRQGLLGMANGSTSSGEFSTWTDAGYDFHFGDFTVGPLGALQYTLVHADGFDEQGSLLPLHIHSDQEASLRTDLGARATYTAHLGNVLVIPTVTAAWEHEYFYTALPITTNFVAFPGQSATLFGPSEGHDSAIINAGAAFQLTARLSTYIGYQGQLGRDHYNANGVTGGFSFSF